MSKKAKSIAEILEDMAKATEKFEEEITKPYKEKLERIRKLVMENQEYFMDGIDGDILQIINS